MDFPLQAAFNESNVAACCLLTEEWGRKLFNCFLSSIKMLSTEALMLTFSVQLSVDFPVLSWSFVHLLLCWHDFFFQMIAKRCHQCWVEGWTTAGFTVVKSVPTAKTRNIAHISLFNHTNKRSKILLYSRGHKKVYISFSKKW